MRGTSRFTDKDLPADTYAVNVTADIGGTAKANMLYAEQGDIITLTAEEGEGYLFSRWDVVDGGITLTGSEFTMPGNVVSVKAVFEQITGMATPGVAEPAETTNPGETESDIAAPGNNSGFNRLWILLGALVVLAIVRGIAFIIIRKKEKTQHDNISEEN